jgi:HSP20 family protein
MLTVNLLSEVDRLQEEMNRLFQGTTASPSTNSPALNIWASEDALMATAELPGMDTSKLDISVNGDALTIRGSHSEPELKEGETWIRQEKSAGTFARTFQLPFRVEADKVDAKYKNGVLYLTLPRAEAEKPKRIAVKSA